MKPLSPNTLIQNRYLVVHLIGKGGMGEVYLAVDQRLGSAVALKRTFFADDEMLGNAFEREAKTLARLRHPVLPKVSDHFVENGEQYLIMEHIAGDDLSRRLEGAQKAFPVSWVLFWADQLLDALSYLHSHEPPIIHRDIKPQNLKLTDENHIVLLDFGLSKNTGQSQIQSGSSGSVVGYTPHYAPMEQIRGTGTSPRSDLYSLSATLYQLMTNTVPVDALTRADALLNGMPDPIATLDKLNPEISPGVSTVILKAMEVSQEKRFGNAREMQKALRKAYTIMQEAMTANTVAFNAQPGLISVPDSSAVSTPSYSDSEVPTRIPSAVARGDQGNNFDATIEYSEPISETPIRQSDLKTEVFNDSRPEYTPTGGTSTPAAGIDPQRNVAVTENLSAENDYDQTAKNNSDFSPELTVPLIAFENQPAAPHNPSTPEFFTNANIPGESNQFATFTPSASATESNTHNAGYQPQLQSNPSVPAKKKSSNAVWLVAGLFVFFFLSLAAAGGGWFYYTNYYSIVEVEPTPAQEPSPEITPSPEPTLGTLVNANTNSNSGSEASLESNSNFNANDQRNILTVAPTPAPSLETTDIESLTRPTPQTVTRKAPGKSAVPGTKPTPKPKTGSDRTVILQ